LSVEQLTTKLRQKISTLSFKSAKFQFAILKEDEVWKIFAIRVVLDDIQEYGKRDIHISQDNFVLEDYWLSLGQFYEFLEYLKRVDVSHGSPSMINGKIPKELFFTLDSYDLCFFGNFPGGELYFHNSQIGKRNGMDKGCYYTAYSLQGSVQSRSHYELSLTHYEPPFHDVLEAMNYYWKSDYEYSTIGNSLSFFLPHLDGSIRNCELEGQIIRINVDVDTKRASLKDISLAVIAKSEADSFREKYTLQTDTLDIDLGFRPLSYTVTMNRGPVKLDESSYYANRSYSPDNQEDSTHQSRTHIIWVDAGFKKDEGGHIAWFNETTNKKFRKAEDCGDSFRCEYAAVIHALQNVKDFHDGDEIEIRADNETVVNQLSLDNAFNKEDLRQMAEQIWKIVEEQFNGKVKFFWVPRGKNKAGKLLGS
jgi:ribonuclease HI